MATGVSVILDNDITNPECVSNGLHPLWISRVNYVFWHFTPRDIADWFEHTDATDRGNGCVRVPKRAYLVITAVTIRRMNILEALKNRMTAEELARIIPIAVEKNVEDLAPFVEIVKEAINYDPRTVLNSILVKCDPDKVVCVYEDYFPEVFDRPDPGVIFSVLSTAIYRQCAEAWDFIASRVSGDIFSGTPVSISPALLLHSAVVTMQKNTILAMGHWLPTLAKTTRVECERPSGCFTALELHRRIMAGAERTEDPEIVAALSVYTKGAHAS